MEEPKVVDEDEDEEEGKDKANKEFEDFIYENSDEEREETGDLYYKDKEGEEY